MAALHPNLLLKVRYMSNTIIHPLTQGYLKSVFEYSEHTGILLWKKEKLKGSRKSFIAGYIDSSVSSGYRKICFNGSTYGAHRIIWIMVYGSAPQGEIDHVDGDRSNNAIKNLRDVSKSSNQKNAKLRSNNSTGIMGVHKLKIGGSYQVTIAKSGKRSYIGTYRDFFEACCVRKSLELKHGYHANHGRP